MIKQEPTIIRKSFDEIKTLDFSNEVEEPKKNKKKSKLKFIVYFTMIIILTALALYLSLRNNFGGVVDAIKNSNVYFLLLIVGVIGVAVSLEGFAIFCFARLYTRNYNYAQGMATSMIGTFYKGVIPGPSGTQVMEAHTLKKQGLKISNGASIVAMSYIVQQICMLFICTLALIFSNGLLFEIGDFKVEIGTFVIRFRAFWLVIVGYLVTIITILVLFLMSYSKIIHRLILNSGINLLTKLHLIKDPEKKRESLRLQVENYKIELRRLFSNIPFFILMAITFSLIYILKASIPFFAGLALDGYNSTTIGQANFASFWETVCISTYHTMVTGVFPIPGGAGISEYFFNTLFQNFYATSEIVVASQIIWRFSTYHLLLLISGIVSATYRCAPKEIEQTSKEDFIFIQETTFEERKATSDELFTKSYLGKNDFSTNLKQMAKPKSRTNKEKHEKLKDHQN